MRRFCASGGLLRVVGFTWLTSLVMGEGNPDAQVLIHHRGQPLPPDMEEPPFPHFPTTNVLPEMDPLVRAAQLNLNPTAAAFAFEFPPTPSGQELQSLSSRQDILQKQEDPDVPSFAPTPSGSSNSKGKSRPRIRRPKRPKVRAESEAESKGSANKKKGRILRTRKPAVFRSKRPKNDNQTDDNDEGSLTNAPKKTSESRRRRPTGEDIIARRAKELRKNRVKIKKRPRNKDPEGLEGRQPKAQLDQQGLVVAVPAIRTPKRPAPTPPPSLRTRPGATPLPISTLNNRMPQQPAARPLTPAILTPFATPQVVNPQVAPAPAQPVPRFNQARRPLPAQPATAPVTPVQPATIPRFNPPQPARRPIPVQAVTPSPQTVGPRRPEQPRSRPVPLPGAPLPPAHSPVSAARVVPILPAAPARVVPRPLPVAPAGPTLVQPARPVIVKSPITVDHSDDPGLDPHPHFHYNYGVSDPVTGDQKSHTETRDGDVVKGRYSFVDSDGSIRTVTYTADSENGFQATVETTAPSDKRKTAPLPEPARPVLHPQPAAAVVAPVATPALPPLLASVPGLDHAELTEADFRLADPDTHTHPLGSHPMLPVHEGHDVPHSHPPFHEHPVIDVTTGAVLSHQSEHDLIRHLENPAAVKVTGHRHGHPPLAVPAPAHPHAHPVAAAHPVAHSLPVRPPTPHPSPATPLVAHPLGHASHLPPTAVPLVAHPAGHAPHPVHRPPLIQHRPDPPHHLHHPTHPAPTPRPVIPHHPPPSLHFQHPHHPHPVHPHPHPHHELPHPPPTVVAFSTPRPAGSPPHGAGVAAHPIPQFGPPHGGLVSVAPSHPHPHPPVIHHPLSPEYVPHSALNYHNYDHSYAHVKSLKYKRRA